MAQSKDKKEETLRLNQRNKCPSSKENNTKLLTSLSMSKLFVQSIIMASCILPSHFAFSQNRCQDIFSFNNNQQNPSSQDKQKQPPPLALQQLEKSRNLSQLFRSNASQFWSWVAWIQHPMKAQKDLRLTSKRRNHMFQTNKSSFSREIIRFEGQIMGDAHLGNIHKVPDIKSKEMKTKNIDLDDGGIGPYFYDFFHFVLSLKVINNKDIKIKNLIQAYLSGLSGRPMKTPQSIEDKTNLAMKDYEILRRNYVERKTSNGKILLKDNEIIAFDPQLIKIDKSEIESTIQSHFGSDVKILDLVIIVKDRGGGMTHQTSEVPESSNHETEALTSRRFWMLLEIKGHQHIYEIKEKQESGLVNYKKQGDLFESFHLSREFFDYTEKELFLTSLGQSYFYIREKKLTLFDVPYKQKTEAEKQFLIDLGNWGAYHLGQWHAQNKNGAEYYNFIQKNEVDFKELLKHLKDEYLFILETSFDQK